MTRALALAVAMLTSSACASEGTGDDEPDCTGSKCDKPDEGGSETCELRQADALDGAQKAYTHEAIRWACSDVEGVNTNGQDDRGQEYCEYFAIVEPPAAEPVRLGRGSDPLGVELTDDQVAALEDDPAAVVGQCVFTSWHTDAPGPLPACEGGECPAVLGFPLSVENARMLSFQNGASAARALIGDCLAAGPAGDPSAASDPLNSDYYRGCMLCSDLEEQGLCLSWRRSDPTICAAMMRMAECGCSVAGAASPSAAAEALIPTQPTASGVTLRGFPLGTWSGAHQLPAGCAYADTGDDSQTIVTCSLTASDLLASANDPKGRCRSRYGDDVVVHVPIDPSRISCGTAPDGPYASTCDADPWAL
jgi:hypothetical protein